MDRVYAIRVEALVKGNRWYSYFHIRDQHGKNSEWACREARERAVEEIVCGPDGKLRKGVGLGDIESLMASVVYCDRIG